MQNIVLIWAWWTWMSGVAWLLHDLWYTNIVAIDSTESELTKKLQDKWIHMIIWHGKYVVQLWDVVIYSEATVECSEVLEAKAIMKAHQQPMIILSYFQFLGEISKYFISVGFAGTNGKSSTTALAIATAKKLLPNFGLGILWALVPDLDNNSYFINPKHKKEIKTIFDFMFNKKRSHELQHDAYQLIKKYYFFVEACEYRRQFLSLDLDYAIITSLELDHTDYYKDMKDYRLAFQQLVNKTKQRVLIPEGLPNIEGWKVERLKGGKVKQIQIKKIDFKYIRWKHNDINGSLVLALLKTLDKDHRSKPLSFYRSKILSFHGLWRRMELMGENKNWAKIFSDYGHMASSITLGYQALKEKFPKQKIHVIFQPHQINRIVSWRDDFIQSMKGYDEVVIYDIYAARENLPELIQKKKELKHKKMQLLLC